MNGVHHVGTTELVSTSVRCTLERKLAALNITLSQLALLQKTTPLSLDIPTHFYSFFLRFMHPPITLFFFKIFYSFKRHSIFSILNIQLFSTINYAVIVVVNMPFPKGVYRGILWCASR